MNTKNFWKIMGGGHTILTDCPNTFKDGDGVYYLMKRLQQIYGTKLCGFQKFDDRFDKIEDFDTILKTGFNLDGNRLISCHLFEYDKDKNEVTINRGKPREMEVDYEYAYRITKKRIGAKDGWDGLRRHILWTMGEDSYWRTMGEDSCWRTWGDNQFGKDFKEKYFNK